VTTESETESERERERERARIDTKLKVIKTGKSIVLVLEQNCK
jgi:hypothetical protein